MTRRHQTVLVPTDFSAGAALALERALRLPFESSAKLVLLHILPHDLGEAARPAAIAEATESLRQVIAQLTPPPGLELSSTVAFGEPYIQIITHARAIGAGLVVVGRHGRRRIRDLFIGSTADRLLRYGDTPVLVVNGAATEPYRRPVIAVDLDDASKTIIELALTVLDPEVEAIDVVHAYHVPFAGLQGAPRAGSFEQELASRARETMSELLRSLDHDARWRATIQLGDTRSVILTEILAHEADLVVLGTHGRTGLAHVVVGSVAEFVIGAARCDVLVTRPARFTFAMP